MTFAGWLTIVLFAVILTALALPLGSYMAKVYTGERVFLTPLFAWPERLPLQGPAGRPRSASRTGRPTRKA